MKNSEVISFIRERALELLDEDEQVYLGTFEHTKNIKISAKTMIEF